MSDVEEAIFERLSTGPGLSALVDTRIYPTRAPQNAPTPFLVYQRISGLRETAFGADPGMVRSRFQLSPYSPDYDEMRAVRSEVRRRIERFRGTLSGVDVDDVFIESDQDLWDDEAQLHYGPLDIIVLHREAA